MGNYVDGRPQGKGYYKWKNGTVYSGDFKNGLRHGNGSWRAGVGNRKTTYEGEYKFDMKNGYGEFHWVTGGVYKGYYVDDERHGKGKMRWNDFEKNIYIGPKLPRDKLNLKPSLAVV